MQGIIEKKKHGYSLTLDEWSWVVKGFVSGIIPDYQMSALLMAVCFQGMSREETIALTGEMMRSGECLDLGSVGRPTVDKHSTGGVGDKVSLALAPLAAAAGLAVPMVSGRGLGHTGGTLDKLASIPGFRTFLTPSQFVDQVTAIGCAIMGQSEGMAPADGKVYALRDVTATVDCIPLIAASIMSKKLAAGPSALVMDVKVGNGAFMRSIEDAERLAKILIEIGEGEGRAVSALLTSMEQPLGFAVGNALEVREIIDLLDGRGPDDLREITLGLAAEMMLLAGTERDLESAWATAELKLNNGDAKTKFAQMLEAQGGDPEVIEKPSLLALAPHVVEFNSPDDGYLICFDARLVGEIAVGLGAGRRKVDDDVDPSVGIVLAAKIGARVEKGQPIAFVHAADEIHANDALLDLRDAVELGSEPPSGNERLILKKIDKTGIKSWKVPDGKNGEHPAIS